jgi:hypothetical protein
MVAIYVPVIQAVEPVYTQVTQTRNFDHKTAFIFRVLHACNEAKDHRVTCLGTAVSYNRRCRNPLYKLTIVLTVNEMIEAAENGTFYFQDLKLYAAKWADGLSCYLHGRQKGVAMAAMGAIAVYRRTFPANVVVPRVQRLGLTPGIVSSAIDHNPCVSLSHNTTHKTLELALTAKKCDKSCAVLGKSIPKALVWIANECDQSHALLADLLKLPIAKQEQELRRLEKRLLSMEKVVFMLCEIVFVLVGEPGAGGVRGFERAGGDRGIAVCVRCEWRIILAVGGPSREKRSGARGSTDILVHQSCVLHRDHDRYRN